MRPARNLSVVALSGLILLLAGCAENGPPQAPGTEYCDVVADYVTPTDCASFARQAALQSNGLAAFNAPNPMQRGETVSVWVAVADRPDPPRPTVAPPGPALDERPAEDPVAKESPAAPPPEAPPAAPEPAPAIADVPSPEEIVDAMPGRTVRFDTIVGPRMAATLTGSAGFEIVPATGDAQHKMVRMGPPYASAIWKWDVTAVRGGVQTLEVRTVVEAIDRRGAFRELASTPATFSFTVQVTPWQEFWDGVADAPKKIDALTAVVAALTALATAVIGLWAVLRRRRARRAAAAEAPPGGTG